MYICTGYAKNSKMTHLILNSSRPYAAWVTASKRDMHMSSLSPTPPPEQVPGCLMSDQLMLPYVHTRPITEIQTVAVLRHPLHPRGDNRRLRLMIYRQPTYIRDGNLLSFVIERNTRITACSLSLLERLIKLGIGPFAAIIVGRREEIEVQPIIGIGEVRPPLRETK